MITATVGAQVTGEPRADGHRHVRYLDGLRGVAILMVVMVHVSMLVHGLPQPIRDFSSYGVRGVQMFFIVSGLTLTLSHRGRPLNLMNFAARRFFRIAPMFYLGAALYLTLGVLTDLEFMPRNAQWPEVWATLAFVHGWSVTANNKIVPGGWSIGCEAMFYLLFPLLLAQSKRRIRFSAITVASYVAAGACYILLRRFVPGDPQVVRAFAFAFWLCQLPAFVSGAWIALGIGAGRLSVRGARILVALSVTGMVIDSQSRGHSNLLVTILLLSLFVYAVGQARPVWLEGRLITRIGEVSFSIYLIHVAIIALLAELAPAVEATVGWGPAFITFYGVTIAASTLLGILTFRFIETPFIGVSRSMFRAGRASTHP